MSLGRRNLKAVAERLHAIRIQSDVEAAADPDSIEFEDGWIAGWDAAIHAVSIALSDVDAGCNPQKFEQAALGR